MSKLRYGSKLLLLKDGRALDIGDGYNECQGECSGFPPISSSSVYADLFDPATNTWTATSGLNANRSNYAAVVLHDGRALAAGGYADPPYVCFSSTKLFDAATGTWTQATGLSKWARCDPAYALLSDGRVLLAGGADISYKPLSNAEIYDPATQTWSMTGSMPAARLGGQAVTLKSGKILVVGGTDANGGQVASAVLYDPASGTWSSAGVLNPAPNGRIVALPDGGALIIGEGYLDTTTDKWSVQPSERFDPSGKTWTNVGAIVESRLSPFVAGLADGRVLVAGGAIGVKFTDSGKVTTLTKSAEIFDPATNSWSATAAMPSERMAGEALLLQDGSVLLAGGSLGEQGEPSTPGGFQVVLLASAVRYMP